MVECIALDPSPSTFDRMMTQISQRRNFIDAYSGEAPWDIGRIQNSFLAIADQLQSPVLDACCGTGDMAVYLSAIGNQLIAFDYLKEPTRRDRARAAKQNLRRLSRCDEERLEPHRDWLPARTGEAIWSLK